MSGLCRAKLRAMADVARCAWADEHGGVMPPIGAPDAAVVWLTRQQLEDVSKELRKPIVNGCIYMFGATFKAGGPRD